ncbi:SURF1 family protein [Nitrosomonas sp. Nm166]|uniref:SURF1 family protein n=1 Tax=Nitrosomonas sp. Nm166 TaxID=1881054 RepID=UPI0008EB4FFF|nr:SURF1 family protein [Nitrosomonas sp. Nm166]SFE44809.1 surfeit locus 1 family protein [Nitrosomonas sp. Nm166]
MIVLGYRFEPKLWAIIATTVSVFVFIELGKWQLSRADEKNARYEQLEQYAKEPAITLPEVLIKLEDFQYRDIEVRGEYLPEHTVYLDNKTYKGRAGYHVVTPLKIANSSLYVAINRGWIATGYDRTILPLIPETNEPVKVTGVVVSPESRALELSDKVLPVGKVWSNFDLQRYQEATGLKMQPIMVLQKDQAEDGLVRDWDKPDSGASKNIGYAVQWFSLAATAIIIFLVLNVRRKNSKS